MISNPAHKQFYPDTNDGMPAFAEHEGDSPDNILSLKEIELIADWLRGDWYEPPGGEPSAEGGEE
jgi:hypothetical protein